MSSNEAAGVRGEHAVGTPDTAETVLDVIAYHAALTPDSVALTCGDASLSYRELLAEAAAVAAGLRSRGLAPESVVALLMRRSLSSIVTMLGVLGAGCAYLALNPGDPPARLNQLVKDADTALALTEDPFTGTGLAVETASVGEVRSADPASRAGTEVRVTAEQLAYVCYTSGSTGAPKGVAVPHRGIVRLVRNPGWITIQPRDVFLQVAPLSFDASTLEIFAALANGCHLVILPDAGAIDMQSLANTVREYHVSVLIVVVGLLHQLIKTRLPIFDSVRHVVTGGDVASPVLVRRLLEARPGLLFTNGYGPTENTTFTTCWTGTELPDSATVPIGVPIDSTQVELLDADLNRVPSGEVGEICTSGAGLARGYLGRPAATAEAFMPNPYGPPGSRTYRTGDLARYLPDGDLEFRGRTDRQVKIQGFRVEPGGVENVLRRRPEVDQAAVVVAEGDNGQKRLVSYVVPAAEAATNLGARLRDDLRRELPSYMVPSAVLVRDEIPLTAHGKVDLSALPAEQGTRGRPAVAGVGHRLKHQLAALWSDLLGVCPIGFSDDFFELGGHSLLAAELLDLVQREFGVEVPARAFYLQPTVAELSDVISNLAEDHTESP